MKKLLLLVPIASLGLFIGCSKESPKVKCQTCTTTTVQNTGIFPVTTSTSDQYCGDDYDDAPAETTVDQTVGGIGQTVTIDCVDD